MTQTETAAAPTAQVDICGLPRVKQELVAPPFVPEHEQVAGRSTSTPARGSAA